MGRVKRYYLDTEFNERPGLLELISLALVSCDDRVLYLEVAFDETSCNDFVKYNVLPHLIHGPNQKLTHQEARECIIDFVKIPTSGSKPQFWGYYADYDWVLFCWLFGAMVDLPPLFPKYCRDLKQELDRTNFRTTDIPKPEIPHRADHDAKWIRTVHEAMLRSEA